MTGRAPEPAPPPLQLGYFHLSANIGPSAPSSGLPDNSQLVLDAVTASPSFLMVGTVKPRKGHLQALDAFKRLCAEDKQAQLAIGGGEG